MAHPSRPVPVCGCLTSSAGLQTLLSTCTSCPDWKGKADHLTQCLQLLALYSTAEGSQLKHATCCRICAAWTVGRMLFLAAVDVVHGSAYGQHRMKLFVRVEGTLLAGVMLRPEHITEPRPFCHPKVPRPDLCRPCLTDILSFSIEVHQTKFTPLSLVDSLLLVCPDAL